MIRALVLSLTLSLAPGLCRAETPMTPEQFRDYATGWTLFFESDATPGDLYGAEQYFDGDRVIWLYSDGTCGRGVWRERGLALCFTYQDRPEVELCWGVYRDATGVFVRLLGGEEKLYVTRRSRNPLACPGPDVGA